MTGQLATVITQPVLLLKQKTNTTIHCLIPIHPKNWLSKIVDLCEFLSRFQINSLFTVHLAAQLTVKVLLVVREAVISKIEEHSNHCSLV